MLRLECGSRAFVVYDAETPVGMAMYYGMVNLANIK